MDVDALAPELERGGVEAFTRREQPCAFRLPPGLHLVAGHAPSRDSANRSQASMLVR